MIDLHARDLVWYLNLLDTELKKINAAIAASRDPVSDGLCDRGEYLVGTGLMAIQHYLNSVRCLAQVKPNVAYATPPFVKSNFSYASALNAGANYWKHQEEWFEILYSGEDLGLKGHALDTLAKLEKVTPWEDYSCTNLLAIMLDGKELELSALLPKIFEWRDNLKNSADLLR
ncbi:hypothetical protein [uncultured Pelagimonas sp.]|uniref:hypothetical protein n=1 Tax=uncultured Pelagimonas sp. TaxID=1618102 RepID=UPI002610A01C|nr:hypothetical protein [uncultured Pelagimonas sp.]